MADLLIDFECEVAAKYELIPAAADRISRNRSEELRDIPENHWPFFLGRIVPVGKTKSRHVSAEKLGSAVRTLVAGLEGKIEPFHIIVLRIVHDLGIPSPRRQASFPGSWHLLAKKLRLMFEGKHIELDDYGRPIEFKWPHPYAQEVESVFRVYLVPDKDNKPVLALRPEGLFAALTLVAARMIATDTTFNLCENCKTPFLSGGSRGRNKRRGGARFCSDRCRYEFHNRRKAR